ncbi:serine/threonine protein kinase [Salinarchaeum sp. Harcht-Bsk1]|uniref:RIO1 family regulatory kinase/ATPase domain-containing protein n=1 Tax=Salinarchaeum sp. Harcht-Bsk1 TaxID=1333523 RepID=UPI0003424139|nr:RIO1 family regulatory kinase/ATPase [Salinarchaeum sp. Harcht-Bsk1]AGN00262.1 serine/threonine protein kinase [Salinarchaeum sp. Harcht-Bsk1]
MDLRELVRGTVDWETLEAIARELAERSDRDVVRIEFMEADNWLSTPLVVDEEWFVKVITPQNARVHGVLTGARNLGMFSRGTEGFFSRFDGPVEMGEHEIEATRRMREIGLDAPEPLEVFEAQGLGVVVLEYLDDYRTLEDLDVEALDGVATSTAAALSTMHEHGLAHGDFREENVLVVDETPHFIDATLVDEAGLADARAYDLACLLAVLEPRIGAARTVEIAAASYDVETVLDASRYLDFVNLRPDHEFDAALLKGEIEKTADA